MGFPVAKSYPVLVRPSEPTPTGPLQLSILDRWPRIRFLSEMIQVFPSGHEPARVIKDALAKALVLYYPIAGRIHSTVGDADVHVECTGEGVWFVEATAECRLEDAEFLDIAKPLMIAKEQLMPFAPADERTQIFMIQVTEFKCGGFVVGTKFSHAMFDGAGIAIFLRAISEIASGLPQPKNKPIWLRDSILTPVPRTPPPCIRQMEPFVPHVIDIPLDEIDMWKDYYKNTTGKSCSTFDIVIGKIWQSKTRAIAPKPGTETKLSFTMCFRKEIAKKMPEFQPDGYYGNCIYYMIAKASCDKIANGSLVEVANIIKECKESLPSKYEKWLKGDMNEDPQKWDADYESLRVSDWRGLGMDSIDYGSGAVPVTVMPTNAYSYCMVFKSPAPLMGVRVMTQFVFEEHLEGYVTELKKLV